MEKKIYKEIDVCKAIGIILVYMGHSIIVYPIDLQSILWCKSVYEIIYQFHMPFMFFLSGYCFIYKNDYQKYLKGKIRRIGIPYIFISVVDLFLRLCMSSLVNNKIDILTGIKNIFLYGGEYWFIYVLFMIYLIFPVIIWAVERCKISIIIIVALSLFLYFFPKSQVMLKGTVIWYLLPFSIGYIARKRELIEKIRNKPIVRRWVLLFSICMLVIIQSWDYNYKIYKILTYCLWISFLLLIVCEMKRATDSYTIYKRINFISQNTLVYYLCEGFILVITRTFIVNICGIRNSFVIVSLLFSLDFVIASFLIIVIRRITILRYLLGYINRDENNYDYKKNKL